MKKYLFVVLLWCIAVPPMVSADEDKSLSISIPPVALEQWYKPANKHNVWLHTMFRLRREMQAVSEYAALENTELLNKWLQRLQKDYASIGKMVPTWADELETELLDKMLHNSKLGKWGEVARIQQKLGKSCQSCHVEYQLVTALRYRAPDFSTVLVEDQETLEEEKYSAVMNRLTLLVNRIKIGSEDHRHDAALTALDNLQLRLTDLGESCSACHHSDHPRQAMLGSSTEQHLQQIKAALLQKDNKQLGQYVGEFAVGVCAECHAIHRMQSDMRQMLSD